MSETRYITVDVFTNQSFVGNQLAVVDIDNVQLSDQNMQMIAREFNFSETVFLRQSGEMPELRIFTPVSEMDFAGHPVIGTGHVIFRNLLSRPSKTLNGELGIKTKAGVVTVEYDSERQTVSAQVPHNVHIHLKEAPKQSIIETQSALETASSTLKDSYPVVSIVKGVTCVLVDFTEHPDNFSAVKRGPSPQVPLDDGWSPSFVGVMYYLILNQKLENGQKIIDLRVRMIAIDLEDPATGSVSCSLATYLSLEDGELNGKYRYKLDQGSEIGRQSYITVDVVLNERGDGISSVLLSGQAAPVMRGQLFLPQ